MTKVLVCGSRDSQDYLTVFMVLQEMNYDYQFKELIQGGAKGIDTHARNWATFKNSHGVNRIDVKTFRADWDKHGKAAGPIRNQQMLDEGKPDLVVAFPGKRGTADMVRRAKNAGVEVIEV